MAKKAEYSEQNITSLKGADRVRKRPAVIFGSDGLEGCEHSFFEILSNSIDEAREGFGNVINVTVYKDKTVEVEDFGRGIPLDWNEKEQRYNWDLVFCELYAGGKYENNDGGAYEWSLGLNGLGACATQYSSEFMDVTAYVTGYKYEMHFKKGEPVGELQKEEYNKRRTGTIIRWKPDVEVFTDTNMPLDFFTSILKQQAIVNAGLTINLAFENYDSGFEKYSYTYNGGILEHVNELSGADKLIHENQPEEAPDNDDSEESSGSIVTTKPVIWQGEAIGRDRADLPEYKLKMQAALCFSNVSSRIEYYHNSSFLEHGGSPDKAVRSAFLKACDTYLRNNGKYGKTEAKISFQDIEDCLILVVSSFSTSTSYENQTKKAITNTFITEAMTAFFLEKLEVYFAENKSEAEKIAAQILINKRSRESAESARTNIKKKLTAATDITSRVEKFANCRTKDATRRELFIVEGDSALTSCKLGRDAEFQAIIPVRGKTLNCLKASYDRIFKSDIIIDLLKVIGCGVEIKTKSKDMVDFNLDNLKWSKIILCTDADEDGFQIRTLILTLFYRLLPTLIKEGKIFIALSPLYEIRAKDKILFAYDEKEKAQIISSLGNTNYSIQRSKGLGENEPDMMWQTTMNPETRRLIRVTPTDKISTEIMFDTLLGDNITARKRFIAENGYRYIDLADL
ncbi:MAG: DNA topoisomerase [Ruminococcaceae bacterium]|nr:DNA topoisomerase [Oscillospiraceae bacterium]